ncbi:pentatricopeptide repeat-containing protein At3g26782, mitochondrial-like [Asparagus officinalis]|uniref:pentatricopeptide repeat-containing protein At3g26782, mitochondrial-like n=1 Tax=Asparagus officinalis TaxID=4686 RepID=UPI00098E51E1|nr:pentatricopeptide repeat-containing protein At3g26782, mitochondrial-like [Asparagus officinalis]
MAFSPTSNPLIVSVSSSISSRNNPKPISLKLPKTKLMPVSSSEFSTLLQSCIDSRSLTQGKELHSQIKQAGFEKNRDLLPKLIKLYSVCGRIDNARELFDRIPKRNLDTFIWTSLISGYTRNGNPSGSFDIFSKMLEHGAEPDGYTFSVLLRASAELGFLKLTGQLHSLLVKCGIRNHLSVDNSLINAYGSAGVIDNTKKVFDRMPTRNVVSWSSMIRVFSSLEKFSESFALFYGMQVEDGIKPNEVTIVSLLPACGFFSSFRKGQAIHGWVIRNGFNLNLIVGSSLVTMYSRCGDYEGAFKIFNSLGRGNVVLWTSMIEGFSMNGKFDLALELFRIMQDQGLKPNYITLVVILSACSHGGLVNEGIEIFESMSEKFCIEPRIEHYSCVVDMLGRGGRLDEAEKFIEKMRVKPTGSVYGTLLGACQVHGNVALGERSAYKLFELEPENAANYVILSNIYASVGRWDDAGRIRKLMVTKGLSKDAGYSWIEIKDKVYIFGAHDKSHLEINEIYEMLARLDELIVKAGHVPSLKFVLLDIEDDDKKKLLCSHSERLAIAFGLLKAPPNVPIRIAKNLRVCGDCHNAIKVISKVVSRKFIIRDTNRFHHFSQGSCSCGDYW